MPQAYPPIPHNSRVSQVVSGLQFSQLLRGELAAEREGRDPVGGVSKRQTRDRSVLDAHEALARLQRVGKTGPLADRRQEPVLKANGLVAGGELQADVLFLRTGTHGGLTRFLPVDEDLRVRGRTAADDGG